MCSVFAWSTLATLQKIAFSEDSSSLLTLSPDELKRRMNVFDGNIEPSLKKRAISKTNGDDEADEKTFRPIFGSACPPNKKVYLDYNATTPLEPSVLDAIFYSLKYAWGNPSSSYSEGKMAKNVIDESRNHVARMINRGSNEIVFTSGGTEANNMVFHSVIQNFQGHENSHKCQDSKDKVKLMNSCNPCPHIVTCNIEHDSVVLALRALKSQGKVEVTEVPVSKETGQVPVNDVIAVIQRNTVLVSFMLANNETGVIQPIEKISKVIKSVNKSREDNGKTKIYVHTDAAQAIGKISVDATVLDVDYLTIVGHKFYAPRIGALYVRDLGKEGGTPLSAMFFGGGQERNYRPGTENTGMIAGLGEACRLVTENIYCYQAQMKMVRDYLEDRLSEEFGDNIHFNSIFKDSSRLPNTCNVSILGDNLQGRKMLGSVETLQASVGAACHSDCGEKPSHILIACGIPETVARNAIRLSVGRYTTKEDIDLVVNDLKHAVDKLSGINVS